MLANSDTPPPAVNGFWGHLRNRPIVATLVWYWR